MHTTHRHFYSQAAAILCSLVLGAAALGAQGREEPGKSIGKITVMGKFIVMELNPGALGQEHFFDLNARTLRFTPESGGYRIENLPLQWDSNYGEKMSGEDVTLHNFSFPFSGKTWNTLSVGLTGSIAFTTAESQQARGGRGGSGRFLFGGGGFGGGVSPYIGRFTPLSEGAESLVNQVPAICVFFKSRMSGDRYAKELEDREVVTWDLSEPYGNIQDFFWFPTVNRFQAVLHKDGTIELSYQQVAAKDAIVGVYPLISGGTDEPVATLPGKSNPSAAEYLDLQDLKLSVVGGMFLKATLETRGPALAEGNPALSGVSYRVNFDTHAGAGSVHAAVWMIRGFAFRRGGGPGGRGGGNAGPRYVAFGPGLGREATASGNTLTIQGLLPPELRGAKSITVSAESSAPGSDTPVGEIPAQQVRIRGLHDAEVHFASLTERDGPFPVAYEAFHYYNLPNPRDLSCTVIKALGDKFDFLAYYSDFRVDNQEAGTPSDGPRGSTGQPVTGIGSTVRGLASYCSKGRFQWGFVQPIYSGAIQTQEYPPANAPVSKSPDDITYYEKQLDEINLDGKMPPYMYAISQIGHEMDHRWGVDLEAKVNGQTIQLGPVHWTMGLQVPVPFPYVRPTEASIMGGGVWQDNHDGTYTQLDDAYFVPATGYSYLDLYDMGLISAAEVPDFFLLQNLQYVRTDENEHRVFKADRLKITIQDVIAAEGPREPDVEHSQRHFNTGFVLIEQHGMKPSERLLDEAAGIREQWMKFFSIVTGRRATMTANPN